MGKNSRLDSHMLPLYILQRERESGEPHHFAVNTDKRGEGQEHKHSLWQDYKQRIFNHLSFNFQQPQHSPDEHIISALWPYWYGSGGNYSQVHVLLGCWALYDLQRDASGVSKLFLSLEGQNKEAFMMASGRVTKERIMRRPGYQQWLLYVPSSAEYLHLW